MVFTTTDFDLWDVIKNGHNIPSKLDNGAMIPKPKQKWDELDKRKTQLTFYIMLLIEISIIVFVNVNQLKKFGVSLE